LKVALITTPPSVRSGIGDYTRHLLPYLREHCDVQLFVEPRYEDRDWDVEEVGTTDRLDPRDFDQVLYQLGNERNHAFMARMIRAIGGTVMQHDWVLFDLALESFPALARGGAKGHALALREGGLGQVQTYARNWLDRRRQRRRPHPHIDPGAVPGTILFGWHAHEENGRWTSDVAAVRIPATDVERAEIDLHVDPGRTVRILQEGSVLFEGVGGTHQLRLVDGDRPELVIETTGITVTKEQREYGDSRRLGACVRRISWKGPAGVQDLDLSLPCAYADAPVSLSRDRFLLTLNRSVVRFADAFIVHSDYVRRLILEDRNASTPIGILHHGSEFRWREAPRKQAREALGLGRDWLDSFLVTSFGGVQPHKRIEKALEALAVARKEREDVRMVLAGSLSGDFDPKAMAAGLGLDDAVHFTGFVDESVGWDWLHAGDVALNLRGPSSGGTSGGIFQAFSMGRSVIASDAAEQVELPDSCVLKIPLGPDEVPTLARTLVDLRDHPERRDELEAGVRRFVEEECHWGIVAKKYAEYLESFPGPRVTRRKLVSLRLAADRRTG
jgi:glycosyltransferase involved in cell wall biosynthesis